MSAPAGKETSLVAWLYLRALGMVYLAAFVSFWVQMEGLVGPNGILPAEETMALASRSAHLSVLDFPTWCWWSASATSLHLQLALGAGLSVLMILGVGNVGLLVLLWSLYLSLATIGRVFMGYQWDNLLLEAGLLSTLLVPSFAVWARGPRVSSRLGLALHRVLVLRLMFSSGFVKLASGDEAWRSLSAMKHHYETQPLPTSLSWFMHQLPDFAQESSVLFVFGVQLIAPWFLFGPRRLRPFAVGALAVLQALILLTGNYGFFNLLALALLITGLDDEFVVRWMPRAFVERLRRRPLADELKLGRWPLGARFNTAFGALLALLAAFSFAQTLGVGGRPSDAVSKLMDWAAPFRSANGYGLFAVMTTERPEIEIEASDDGVHFEPYVFRYKAGPLDRAPRQIVPHMPRLDWQMWFAALGRAEQNPWFQRFLLALLEARPPVLALLERSPFGDRPPRFVRATFWDYQFTSPKERADSGQYWRRELRGLYFGPVERPTP